MSAFGEYLRRRRPELQPGDVGLPNTTFRRVEGLRREGLAQLAGVSSDYYTRLEQGRDLSPSAAVLDALAGALNLHDHQPVQLHSDQTPGVTEGFEVRARGHRSKLRPTQQLLLQLSLKLGRDGGVAAIFSERLMERRWESGT